MCICKWVHGILGAVIFVLALWPMLLGAMISKWVLAIAGLAILAHALFCHSCCGGACETHEMHKKPMPARRRR